MHKPYTIDDLIKVLQNYKNKDKEVVMRIAFNEYDVISFQERAKDIVLDCKLSHKRDWDEKQEI